MSLDVEARSAKGTVIAARIMALRANYFRTYVQTGYDTEKKLARLEQELAKLGITRRSPNK